MIQNSWLLAEEAFIIVLIAIAAVALHRFVQLKVPQQMLRRHNDVAGFLFSVVGVIYAVLLGFVVIVVWEKFDAAEANVTQEVAAVSDLYRYVGTLPDPLRTNVRAQLRWYIKDMITDEWPQMTKGRFSNTGRNVAEKIAFEVDRFRPRNAGEQDVHNACLEQVQRLFDARRVRLYQIQPSVPPVLWFALIVGAATVLGFAFLFGVENGGAQLLMTAGLASVMAVLFVVIVEFDQPFSGAVGVDLDGWNTVQERIAHML